MTGRIAMSPAAGVEWQTRPFRGLCLFVAIDRAAAQARTVFARLPLFYQGGQRPL
jgi:hypothetical protein